MKEVTMFNFESSYILKQKGCGYRFFELKERNGDTLTFRLRQKDNHLEVSGIVFISKGEKEEVFAFTWNGQRAFLTATNFIGKGHK